MPQFQVTSLWALACLLFAPCWGVGQEQKPLRYVGARVCAACHAVQSAAWETSDHARAMQVATSQTVLGDFTGAKFQYGDVTTRFFGRGGKYFVHTDGPDGKLADFEIAYTFGVYPLQQYLIALPGGRLQAFGIAWDSRPRGQGGQRWYHLYPDQKLSYKDSLHWTGLDQNWNYQCAACHSTDLKKHYDPEQRTFKTKWSDINVACEACHGPASQHVELARANKGKLSADNSGLAVHFTERKGVDWTRGDATGTARRSVPRTTSRELDVCAQCHARRGAITEDVTPGRAFLDTHRPAFLTEELYFPDGQIKGEVYEYGSFLQSKMNAAGVTCGDCHDPHTAKVRTNKEVVCLQCHAPAKFATPQHHHHKPDSSGASCLNCHMPERTYMGVDVRRDHSFRIPRPDLSRDLATPNACSACHTTDSSEFISAAFLKWYTPKDSWAKRYGEAFHAARSGHPGSERKLRAIAQDSSLPGIARGTALVELQNVLTQDSLGIIAGVLTDKDPLVRLGALIGLANVDPRLHFSRTAQLLTDSVLAVRVEAAALLAGIPSEVLNATQRHALDAGIREYIATAMANAERPEEHLNLGLLFSRMGNMQESEKQYRQAMQIEASFAPAYVNLADLLRAMGRDKEGEAVLRKGLTEVPDNPTVEHALALLLVRENRSTEALPLFEHAAKLAPENARYSYVYAVALKSAGFVDRAREVLMQTYQRHPRDPDVLSALVAINREAGHMKEALFYEKMLAEMR